MDISYRSARREDYEQLIGLYGDFVKQPERYINRDNDSFHAVLGSSAARLFVAEDGAKLIGFVSFSSRPVFRYPKPIVEVEELYVHPEYRRRGIARKLMDIVHESPQAKAAQYVFLASDKKRTEAHEFYKALGYDEYAFHFRKRC